MKNFLIVSIVFLVANALRAQSILFQENFTTGIPATWAIVNGDGLTPQSSVSNFTNAWISYQSTTDTCAASTSYYSPAGQAADYLITPKITLNSFTKLVWSARSFDASYAETYLVLISSTDSLITSFTDTLMVVGQELYYWQKRSVHLDLEGYANQDVYIAFKNISDDKYILLIDNVKILGSDFASIENNEINELVVYPNPTVDFITVSNFTIGDNIVVYSLDGQVILTSWAARIDLTDFAAGTYILTVTNDSGTSTHKIVKQ
jgi:hypothetical protein